MVWPCASAAGGGAMVSASSATRSSAGTRRARVMGCNLLAKSGRTLTREDLWRKGETRRWSRRAGAAREDEPLAALAAPHGAERRLGALEAERRREAAPQLGP